MAEDHSGHRARLKKRFINSEPYQYEPRMSLELLLFGCVARRDTTELSQRLLTKFGSFNEVFKADIAKLSEVRQVGNAVGNYLEAYGLMMRRFAVEYAACQPLLSQTAFEVMFERVCAELTKPCAVVLFTDKDGRAFRLNICNINELCAALSETSGYTTTVCLYKLNSDETKEVSLIISEMKNNNIASDLFICTGSNCEKYCRL